MRSCTRPGRAARGGSCRVICRRGPRCMTTSPPGPLRAPNGRKRQSWSTPPGCCWSCWSPPPRCRTVTAGARDRAQARRPARVRRAAAAVGGGTDSVVADRAPAPGPGLPAAARALRGPGQVGHDRSHDPPAGTHTRPQTLDMITFPTRTETEAGGRAAPACSTVRGIVTGLAAAPGTTLSCHRGRVRAQRPVGSSWRPNGHRPLPDGEPR